MILALDFETANPVCGSICAVGVVEIAGGRIVRRFEQLIRPHASCRWFSRFNIAVHGITPAMVREAPEWDEVWALLAGRFEGATVVAHNAAFDILVLAAALRLYDLRFPELEFLCTCKSARRAWPELPNHRLDTVAGRAGFHFMHHRAGDDAAAAAAVLCAMMQERNCSTVAELADALEINLGRLSPAGCVPCLVRSRRKKRVTSHESD